MEVTYRLIYTKRAIKDIQNLKASKLAGKAKELCELPLENPATARSKRLVGDLHGKRSIRINLRHRLVYEILEQEKIIKILSMWSHYGDN